MSLGYRIRSVSNKANRAGIERPATGRARLLPPYLPFTLLRQ
jgi:hypothetical protein